MKPGEVGIVVVGVMVVVSVSVVVGVTVMTLVLEMVSTIVLCKNCMISLSPFSQKLEYEIKDRNGFDGYHETSSSFAVGGISLGRYALCS